MTVEEHGRDDRTDLEKDIEAWNLPRPVLAFEPVSETGAGGSSGSHDERVNADEPLSS